MPTDERLDEMAMKIAGVRFAQLGPDHRAVIMKLAIQADISADTQLMAEHIGVAAQHLDSIDKLMQAHDAMWRGDSEESDMGIWQLLANISEDTDRIGAWFKNSRLFDGIPS